MPHFATERGCGQFAWLQGLLFSKPKPRKGGQGTMGPLRRFFGDFLSAGGKKVTRRRQDKVAARQGVRERQRRGQSPSHGLRHDRVGSPLRQPIGLHCSWSPIGALPRNRLAYSAAGSASPVSPLHKGGGGALIPRTRRSASKRRWPRPG